MPEYALDANTRALAQAMGAAVGDVDAKAEEGKAAAVPHASYADAVAFCEWLSRKEGKHYRLPTEAEWEYACRAGTYYLYNTGDGLPEAYRKNQQTARDLKPVSLKVGQTPPNAFGLCDMHGNVEEWCLDWYGPYRPEDQSKNSGNSRTFVQSQTKERAGR